MPAIVPAASPTVGNETRLDSGQATQAAKAAGLKVTLIVPNAVVCPAVAKPAAPTSSLAAKGKLAGLMVDIDGFLGEENGVPEAVALLGRPVLCNRSPASGYLDMHLAPRDASVRQVTVETHDGDLIGIVVELEKTVTVDLTDLKKRFGEPRHMPGPTDSFEAGSDVFSAKSTSYSASLSYAHRDHADPPTARQVHEIIYRRTPMVEILPEGFRSASDLVRLVALALRSRAPEAVRFAGTLGLYQQPVNDRLTFGSALPTRNVTSAVAGVRSVAGRVFVRTLDVAFTASIPANPDAFARDVGAALKVPAPAVVTDGTRRRLDIALAGQSRGKVVLDVAAGGVRSVTIERAD